MCFVHGKTGCSSAFSVFFLVSIWMEDFLLTLVFLQMVNLSTCHPFYQVVASRQHTTTSKRAYLEATQTNQVCFKPKLDKNSSGAKSNNLSICSDDVGVFFQEGHSKFLRMVDFEKKPIEFKALKITCSFPSCDSRPAGFKKHMQI